MNNLPQIFNSPRFGEIRTIEIDGKIHFVASDIAKALGYTNPSKAINDHCKGVTKRYIPHPQNPDKALVVNIIPEGDVYRLTAKSELPTAEEFEKWIFDEVLPTIRKHGAYLTPQKIEEVLLNPDTIIKLATELKAEREAKKALESKTKQDEPKVLFADSVASSTSSILIGDLAKILRQNGIEVGQNRLFDKLRNDGFLIKQKGTAYNSPTQRAMELGLFEVKETVINNPDGSVRITKTPKVTGKGQIYFINYFIKAKTA